MIYERRGLNGVLNFWSSVFILACQKVSNRHELHFSWLISHSTVELVGCLSPIRPAVICREATTSLSPNAETKIRTGLVLWNFQEGISGTFRGTKRKVPLTPSRKFHLHEPVVGANGTSFHSTIIATFTSMVQARFFCLVDVDVDS